MTNSAVAVEINMKKQNYMATKLKMCVTEL